MEDSKDIESKCPIQYTLNLIGGKWKLVILWHLSIDNVLRYGEIKKSLSAITHKMLSQQLKELESDGLIHREEYHQIPPKVEYSLTDLGKSLLPVLQSIFNWGKDNMS
jgi:DNA-binding HxlR family transcriptional regulator